MALYRSPCKAKANGREVRLDDEESIDWCLSVNEVFARRNPIYVGFGMMRPTRVNDEQARSLFGQAFFGWKATCSAGHGCVVLSNQWQLEREIKRNTSLEKIEFFLNTR